MKERKMSEQNSRPLPSKTGLDQTGVRNAREGSRRVSKPLKVKPTKAKKH